MPTSKMSQLSKSWFQGEPSIDKFLLPIPDPVCPWGNTDCKECRGKCRGHYMKPEADLKNIVQNLNKAAVKPLSVVIKEQLQGLNLH